VEVEFGYGAEGVLFTVGNGFQWVSEAGPAPQLDFHEDERLGSNIQTLTTPELGSVPELLDAVITTVGHIDVAGGVDS
jgi:hypothetical protein